MSLLRQAFRDEEMRMRGSLIGSFRFSPQPSRTTLITTDMTLLMPLGGLTAEVCRDGGLFLASEPQTGAFGEGETVEEAVADLRSTLQEALDDLVDHHNRLTPAMVERMRFLASSLAR
jgi:predicted RNase H-like HicB family nuclease